MSVADALRDRILTSPNGRERRRAARVLVRRPTSSQRALPDFLIIGAQKSGTTSLYDYLCQHPQVRPAMTKEVHYFDFNFTRGTRWYRSHFPLGVGSRNWVTGEATPYYLFHPETANRA